MFKKKNEKLLQAIYKLTQELREKSARIAGLQNKLQAPTQGGSPPVRTGGEIMSKPKPKPKPTHIMCPYCGVKMLSDAVKCPNCQAPRCTSCSEL